MGWKVNKDGSLDPTQVFLIVAKHRNGPLAEIPLIWDGTTTTFRSTEKDANIASLEATAPPPITQENRAAFDRVSKELEALGNVDDDIFDAPPIDDIPPEIPPETDDIPPAEPPFEPTEPPAENMPANDDDFDPIF